MDQAIPAIETEDPGLDPAEQRKLDKLLVGHCQSLYKAAKEKHPTERLRKFENYYNGRFEDTPTGGTNNTNLSNNFNIISPIVNTIVTNVLDAQITTSIQAKNLRFEDLEKMNYVEDMADVMESAFEATLKANRFQVLRERILKTTNKTGVTIVKACWDAQKSNGLGDVLLEEIDPRRFFPDPNGKKIEECNYVTVETSKSVLTLKKLYPQLADRIDELAKKQGTKNSTSDIMPQGGQAIISARTSENAQQLYAGYQSSFQNIQKLNQNITVFECYLIDDTTFAPDKDDNPKEMEFKDEERFKYPQGRVIIYAGEDVIFEDKAIDYPFGFPFEVMNKEETDDFWGIGTVEALIEIQDRINRAYWRLQTLVAKYISALAVDATMGIKGDSDLINAFTIRFEAGAVAQGRIPQLITNNTLNEIENCLKYIDHLKLSAKEISRVNDIMLSGQKQEGVNSGTMVNALIESPMTSIREMQRVYWDFLVRLSNKALKLIGKYYTVDRIVRLNEGRDFAYIRAGVEGQPNSIEFYGKKQVPAQPTPGQISQEKTTQEIVSIVKTIQGDLSILDFELEIVAGAEMPKNSQANANLTMQFYRDAIFGDPQSIDAKREMLKKVDYPGWRQIIQRQEEQEEKERQMPAPTPGSLVESVSLSFKDFWPDAQKYIQNQLGIPNENLMVLPPDLLTPPPQATPGKPGSKETPKKSSEPVNPS